jgi:putative transposase
MPRVFRSHVSQESGSYHLMSYVVGAQMLLLEIEKEYLFELIKLFSAGFFIRIHAYAIMSNHFHLLVTCMEKEARSASKEELIRRYKLCRPNSIGHPEGTYDKNGNFLPDADGGIERLRKRLGSVSCFMGELKQTFTCWYNDTNRTSNGEKRKGYFWGQRFNSVIVSLGEAQLVCSTYIDLNSIRAGIVERPESYLWSSLGLRVGSKGESADLLYPLVLRSSGGEDESTDTKSESDGIVKKGLSLLVLGKHEEDDFSLYREFVYKSGAVERAGKASIPIKLVKEVADYHGALGVSDSLRFRVRNISEGLAFGSYEMIASFQALWNRKYIRPRSFMEKDKGSGTWSYSTRVLRL